MVLHGVSASFTALEASCCIIFEPLLLSTVYNASSSSSIVPFPPLPLFPSSGSVSISPFLFFLLFLVTKYCRELAWVVQRSVLQAETALHEQLLSCHHFHSDDPLLSLSLIGEFAYILPLSSLDLIFSSSPVPIYSSFSFDVPRCSALAGLCLSSHR